MPAGAVASCQTDNRLTNGLFSGLSGLRLHCGYGDGIDNIFRFTAAGKVVCRLIKSLKNWADRRRARESFSKFVSDIAGLQIRKDQNICLAGD